MFKPKDPTFGFFENFFAEKKLKFFGNWKNSKPNGLGFALTQSSVDLGEFRNGFLQGFCRKVLANGNVIIGEFHMGLLQGSCIYQFLNEFSSVFLIILLFVKGMMFDKEKNSWILSSFRNGEMVEILSEGISEFPPIFKYSIEKTPNFQEIINEDFIEKPFLDKILAKYKKIDCLTPIKVPLIEIEGKSQPEPSNFSTVYSKIIDKNNPFNSPKSKSHISIQKPKQSPKTPIIPKKHPSFTTKGTRESPLKYPISPQPRNFSASKPKLMKNKTAINFYSQKKSPSISPMDNNNDNNNNNGTIKKSMSPYNDNKTRKLVKQTMHSSTAANFFGKTLLTNSEINAKVCNFGKKQAESPNRMGFSVYCAKNSNPVFMLDDDTPFEEKKAPESPINRLVMKLKKEPRPMEPEEKPQDFCREIEGVNNIIEAALDEDQMMSAKIKKSKSSGIH